MIRAKFRKRLPVTLTADLTALLDKAFAALDDQKTPVSEILRQCHRIAARRNDVLALAWLELELQDTKELGREERLARRLELSSQVDPELWEAEWARLGQVHILRRSFDSRKGMVYGNSVYSLERHIARTRELVELLVVPENMAPLDVAMRSKEYTDEKFKMLAELAEFETIADRLRVAAHRYLVNVEYKLSIGQVGSDAYERNREYVDQHLSSLDNEALEQFHIAYRRAQDGDGESLSHALTSCRRVLKSVADAIYPARREPLVLPDGTKVMLTDDKYVNRLMQAVREGVGSHGPGEAITATLTSLYGRLRALDGLASKGVHADVSEREVDICIVQTYLVLGDVLRYRAGHFVPEAAIAADIEAEAEITKAQ